MSQRTSKRNTVHFGSAYLDRIPLEEDFEAVQAHTTSRTAFNHAAADLRSFPVPSPWTIGRSWAPEESTEFSLDPDAEWYDEALEANIADVMESIEIPSTRRRRSQASVSEVSEIDSISSVQVLCRQGRMYIGLNTLATCTWTKWLGWRAGAISRGMIVALTAYRGVVRRSTVLNSGAVITSSS